MPATRDFLIRRESKLSRARSRGVSSGQLRLILGRRKIGWFAVDFAGAVETVGASVTRFQLGDEVFGGKGGAFAEQCAFARSEESCRRRPTGPSSRLPPCRLRGSPRCRPFETRDRFSRPEGPDQ